MHVWVVTPPATGGSEDAVASQAKSIADIILFHIREHSLPGANVAVRVYSEDDKACKSLSDIVAPLLLSDRKESTGKDNGGYQLISALRDYKTETPRRHPLVGSVYGISRTRLVTDTVLVMAGTSAFSFVKDLTDCNGAEIARPASSSSVTHVHMMPWGSATLCAPPELPYKFTGSQDWFSGHIPEWRRLVLPHLMARVNESKPVRMLELGSWEGRSSTWLLQNVFAGGKVPKGSKLVCVDHFDLMMTSAGKERRAALDHNLTLTGLSAVADVRPGFTAPVLFDLLKEGKRFDFVYIDASHTRSDVLLDAMLVWRCVEAGAVVVFDDYMWPNHPRESPEHPAEGIDAFIRAHREQLEIVKSGYQLIVRRIVAEFRGFEWPNDSKAILDNSLAEGGSMWQGRM